MCHQIKTSTMTWGFQLLANIQDYITSCMKVVILNLIGIMRLKKKLNTNIFLKIKTEKLGAFTFDFNKISNYTFFNSNNLNNLIVEVNQIDSKIEYLLVKWHKEFKFGKFRLDNQLAFQNVKQTGDFLNVPKFISRNTFYYSNKILKGALFFQTGFSFKYFTKFYANEYNPAISSFHIQNQKKIGGFPLFDFFANAKSNKQDSF